LAGSDDGYLYIWKHDTEKKENGNLLEDENDEMKYNEEFWSVLKTFKVMNDIYDISWSPNSSEIICGEFFFFFFIFKKLKLNRIGSTDNTATIFNVEKGEKLPKQILSNHSNYVQGVS
jgi:WD40 repeat protein